MCELMGITTGIKLTITKIQSLKSLIIDEFSQNIVKLWNKVLTM
jgi:hypothetical protein